MADIKEFHESFSSPIRFFLIVVPDQGVSSSDIRSVEVVLDVNFILIRTSCIETEIHDSHVFVFNVLIYNLFDGVGIFVRSFIHLLRIGDYLFQLSNSSELFFLFCPFDWVAVILLRVFLVWLLLHVSERFIKEYYDLIKIKIIKPLKVGYLFEYDQKY